MEELGSIVRPCVKDIDPNNPIARYTYMEDGVGNITLLNDAVDSTYNRTFTYDDLNRVKTANTQATPSGATGRTITTRWGGSLPTSSWARRGQ